jgi:nicotinamidase-related amidase
MARPAKSDKIRSTRKAIAVPVRGTALLLIDINDLAFEGSAALVAKAEKMASRLATLKRRASAAGVPVIYLNDNFGQWPRTFGARSRTARHARRRVVVCRYA